MARPRLKIDPEQVRTLAGIQCSYAEMAAVLRCSSDTLERRFAEVIKEGRETGKCSLKRKQYEVAMGGNVGMLIWLGKQYLGQSEKVAQFIQTNITTDEKTNALAESLREQAREQVKWIK